MFRDMEEYNETCKDVVYRSKIHILFIYSFETTFFSFSVRRQSLFPGEKRSCSKGKYYDASIRNRCPRVTPYPPPPYRYETLTVPIIAYPQSRSLFPSSFPLHPLSSSSSTPVFTTESRTKLCKVCDESCPARSPSTPQAAPPSRGRDEVSKFKNCLNCRLTVSRRG